MEPLLMGHAAVCGPIRTVNLIVLFGHSPKLLSWAIVDDLNNRQEKMRDMRKDMSAKALEAKFDLATRWVEYETRSPVQQNRYRELSFCYKILTETPDGHAGYERGFDFHYSKMKVAILRDPIFAQEAKDIDRAHR